MLTCTYVTIDALVDRQRLSGVNVHLLSTPDMRTHARVEGNAGRSALEISSVKQNLYTPMMQLW